MRASVKEPLRLAWHSVDTEAAIARSYGVSPRTVRRFWARERADGRLPDHARPNFAKFSPIGFASDAMDADIGEDRAISPRANRIACGASLAALRAAHGDSPLRAFDSMPKQTLQMEINGFPPSEERLRQFNRVRDRFTTAILKRRAGHAPSLETLARQIDERR